MANLRYYNNSGPFWDFIASMEDNKDMGQRFNNHPFFGGWGAQNNEDAAGPSNSRQADPTNEEDVDGERETTVDRDTPMDDPAEVAPEEWSPWEGSPWPFGPGFGAGFMRGGRGRGGHGHGRGRGGRMGHPHGPPPPGGPGHHRGPPPPGPAGEHPPPPPVEGEFPSGEEGFRGPPPPGGFEHGRRHHGGPGGPGPRGGRGGRGGRCGGRGRDGPPFWKKNGMPFDMSNLGEFFQNQFFGTDGNNERSADAGDFTPPVDIFDTEAAFVVHVSLPGAKKEDIAVNWDAERSELNITGVIHRPGDEEFLKTLALDERKVGAFSRKVRLGSRINPAQVDAECISAKLEEGILRVNVPKEDKEFDVIHKVDIE